MGGSAVLAGIPEREALGHQGGCEQMLTARHPQADGPQLIQQRRGVAAKQHAPQRLDLQFAGAHALGEQAPEGAQPCFQEATTLLPLIQNPTHQISECRIGREGVPPEAGGGETEGPSWIR